MLKNHVCRFIVTFSILSCLATCKQRSFSGSSHAASVDQVGSASSQGTLSQGILKLSTLRPRFVLTRFDQGKPETGLAPAASYEGNNLHMDFATFRSALSEAEVAALNHSLSRSLPLTAKESLSDPFATRNFSVALFQALDQIYEQAHGHSLSKMAKMQTVINNMKVKREDCQGSDLRECHIFDFQKNGALLTSFELLSLMSYTEARYKALNAFLRVQTRDEAAADAVTETLDTVDTLLSLGVISAINKVDKWDKPVMRGVRDIYPGCASDAPTLPPSSGADPAAKFSRFCSYFSKVSTYVDCGFVSASTDKKVAMSYMGRWSPADKEYDPAKTPILFNISGKSGIWIKGLSSMETEEEVLFKPGIPFRLNLTQTGGVILPDRFIACSAQPTKDELANIAYYTVGLEEPDL